MPQFVYPFLFGWAFGMFPVWGYDYKLVMNVHVQRFPWTCVFISLGEMHRTGIAELYGNIGFSKKL